MILDKTATYKRIDNILYQDDVAIVKFTFSRFCDVQKLSEGGVDYMQRYMDGYRDKNYFYVLSEVTYPLDRSASYKRINNVLFKDNVAIVKLHSAFTDIEELTEEQVQYMERFIHENAEWREILYDGHIVIVDDPIENPCLQMKDRGVVTTIKPSHPPYELISGQSSSGVHPVFAQHYSRGSETQEECTERLLTAHTIAVERLDRDVSDESHDPNSSRLDQVRFWIEKGLTTSASIAEKIGGHPSYVSRLIKQVKDEKDNHKS